MPTHEQGVKSRDKQIKEAHGSQQSWKVLEFKKSPGKSWNFAEILEKSWKNLGIFFVVKQSKREISK